jgi:hypothetical protein
MPLQITGEIEVQSDHACVVYDAKTGRIHHVHRVVTLKGGEEPKPGEIESRATHIAAQKGRNASELKTLMVAPDRFQPGAKHRVDPQKGTLISEPTRDVGKRPS